VPTSQSTDTTDKLESDGRRRRTPSWQKKERAVHDLKHSERTAVEIARKADVSRQTLYDWERQYDQALDLVWGRAGGLKQLMALEAALKESQRAERAARDAAASANREVVLQSIANEYLRSTREVIPENGSARAALLAAVTSAKAVGLTQRELAEAIGMSEPTFRRHLSPPDETSLPAKSGQYPRQKKVEDPEIQEAVRALRTENPTWGPKRIAHELAHRTENPIEVGHNTVARILKTLGLSRSYDKKERSTRQIEITCPLPITASDLKEVPLQDGTKVFFMPVVFLVFRALLGFTIFRHFPTSAEVRDAISKILSGTLDGAVFAHKTDNGTETKGAFREFLKAHGIFRWTGIPYWPRSNGIVERLIQTFDKEVLQGKVYKSLEDLVAATVAWADRYNVSRPHEALGGIAPLWKALNWLVDPVERLRHLEVLDDSIVELVAGKDGRVLWKGESVFVGRCFAGTTIGLLERDGWISIWVEGVPLFRISSTPKEAAA
jgi:transposase InsO family protein/DNA-binding XRE family transcriptional regulator